MKKLNISNMEHLLVVVPHQDDEILIGAGLIYEMLKQKKKVTVAVVTNGDYGCKDYSKGRTRLRETLDGLEILGMAQEHIVFLGYADTGMPKEDSFLAALYYEKDGDKVFPSSASTVTYGLEEKQDFHYQCLHEHGQYSRNTLICDLRELIRKTQPDCVLTTHKSDMHGDHEGLFYFVKDMLEELEEPAKPRLLVSVVHSPEGDDTWPVRNSLHYTCPKGLERAGLKWEDRLVLDLSKELMGGTVDGNLKYEALKEYKTALEPEVVDYLMSYVKDEEIFWEMEYQYE